MAMLDEELVEQWLNQQGFFTMRGVKCGVDEIDLLALRYNDKKIELLHVEVQVSFRPIGYIGGDKSAKRRTDDEIRIGVKQWVEKKFTSERKVDRRKKIVPSNDWSFVLVCAELKDEKELHYMRDMGVKVVRYKDVLKEVMGTAEHQTSSIANNIIEILKYTSK